MPSLWHQRTDKILSFVYVNTQYHYFKNYRNTTKLTFFIRSALSTVSQNKQSPNSTSSFLPLDKVFNCFSKTCVLRTFCRRGARSRVCCNARSPPHTKSASVRSKCRPQTTRARRKRDS